MSASAKSPDRAGHGDAAAVHHGDVVGQLAGQLVVLLDQQDGEVAARRQRADRRLDVLDDGRLDALGGLVEQQQLRPGDQGAADGQLLLLAAGQVAAAPRQHVRQRREQLEHLVRHPRFGARQGS